MTRSLLAFVLLLALPLASRADEPASIDFNRDIRPILSNHCFTCHGFDANTREADLRLDVPESAFEDRGDSTAIRPGDVENSELWRRITSDDPDMRMPPESTQKPLSAEQIELLRRWIAEGAPYDQHWAFVTPSRPAEPEVQDTAWPRNAIDRFILAKLEAEGLRPQPQADRETLIRRLAFALTGLPPTVEEVEHFLADDSPDAYDKLVSQYLDSPRYGEEMARHWLDVARYADTHGLHLDNERIMWAYRDWVVRAMNDNLPFDQFTIWQLAGDLLPNPTTDQLIATGFNRCNVTTSEGGSIAEEFLYRYAVERTSTAIEAWMGLTGGCAVCHDHKYDPLSAREFYSMYAFFYSAADPAMDGNINNTPPFLKLPGPGQQERLDNARQLEQTARQQLEEFAGALSYQDPAELETAPPSKPIRDVLFDDAFPPGVSVRNTTRNPSVWTEDPEFGVHSGRRALRLANSYFHEEVLQYQLQPITAPEEGQFEFWIRTDPHQPPTALAVTVHAAGSDRRAVWGDGAVLDARAGSPPHSVVQGELPAPGEWSRLLLPLSTLNIEPGQPITRITIQETGGVVWCDGLTIFGNAQPAVDARESLRVWWSGIGSNVPPDVPANLHGILTAGIEKASEADRAAVQRFYLASVARPLDETHAEFQRAWQAARAERIAADEAIPGTMIFRDLEQPREAFVMLRGQYDQPGDPVKPGVPAVLPPLAVEPPERVPNRLDLAKWLVAPEHPLTARVTVNRFWQQFFGTGLVKTSFDFGAQGEMPSHPELLDWLAVDFRESGWDVKRLVRMLVTSATFRQASAAPPDLYQRDPENRLYARGPRIRLDAEQIRDNVLFVSGLMTLKMGGPGVMPYQPPNIWEPVGYADSNTRYYLQDHGSDLYRRSLYVFLKRTAPPPFMSNFDAPNREQFCSRRERSNTPLQALQLLNDVQHFEAARALAERVMREAGADSAERVRRLYLIVLARHPDEEEIRLVLDMLAQQQALFAADPAAAERAIHTGESAPQNIADPVETAAWTLVANLVLNLDETINRN